jgi:hypothetical protein
MEGSGTATPMETVLRFRGREIGSGDVGLIRQLIAGTPTASRRALSLKICEAWGWVQNNGAPRDGVCRSLLHELARAGHITLPPSRRPNWSSRPQPARRRPQQLPLAEAVPVCAPLGGLAPVEIRQVRRTPDEALVDALIAQHHYLGQARSVGERLKYLVVARGQPVACFEWSSAPLHLDRRDEYIGWSPQARRTNLHLVAYQVRFLILPWIQVPHLASHLLGRMSRRLSADWEQHYAHPIHLVQTFVDPSRYRGTCYRAANWTYLGMTVGRGHRAATQQPTRQPKQVWAYALAKDFRRRLCAVDE